MAFLRSMDHGSLAFGVLLSISLTHVYNYIGPAYRWPLSPPLHYKLYWIKLGSTFCTQLCSLVSHTPSHRPREERSTTSKAELQSDLIIKTTHAWGLLIVLPPIRLEMICKHMHFPIFLQEIILQIKVFHSQGPMQWVTHYPDSIGPWGPYMCVTFGSWVSRYLGLIINVQGYQWEPIIME